MTTYKRKEGEKDFFKAYIRVFSEIKIKRRDCILTNAELEFLYLVYLSIKGGRRDIYSRDIIRSIFHSNNEKLRDKRALQVRVKLVTAKGWLTQKGSDFYILGGIEDIMNNNEVNISFNLVKNND